MVRKISIFVILGALVGGILYFILTYSVVALYDLNTPKVSYLHIVKKPERGWDVYYNYIDRAEVEKALKILERTNNPVPWHLDYDWVVNHKIYTVTLDNR